MFRSSNGQIYEHACHEAKYDNSGSGALIKILPVQPLIMSLVLLSMSASAADVLEVGDTFPEFTANDQHEREYRFEPGTKAILIAFDMATGKKANAILANREAGFLDHNSAVYIANVYGMPAIGRFFAIPKMKKYPHRIVLADEINLLSPFPREENRITVIRLNDSAVVQSIAFWDPREEPLQNYISAER